MEVQILMTGISIATSNVVVLHLRSAVFHTPVVCENQKRYMYDDGNSLARINSYSNYSGTPVNQSPKYHKKMAILTGWPY